MLLEGKGVAQQSGEGRKRWFSDQEMELIVWLDGASQVDAFQLCYVLSKRENVLSWSRIRGYSHARVDPGDDFPTANRSPSLSPSKTPANMNSLASEFGARSTKVDPQIRDFVLRKLYENAGVAYAGESRGTQPPGNGATPGRRSPGDGGFGGISSGHAGGGGRGVSSVPIDFRKRSSGKTPAALFPADEAGPAALPDELIKKVKRIEITTRKVVTDVMSGQYRSHFKGHGVQFSEHRVYNPGDDVRHIDWKVSARSKELLLKKFEEERELTVFLVVDISGSERFGSQERLKSEITAEVASLLSYAAVQTGDKVGVLLFAGEVEKIIPPKKGRQHVLRVVRELLAARPRTRGTDLATALDAANRIMKHAGIVFVISDFLSEDFDIPLKRLARRHDVVAIWTGDPKEQEAPKAGMFWFQDPETGKDVLVDAGSYAFRKWFEEFRTERETDTQSALNIGGVERVKISTEEDYGEAIVRFFRARGRRRR